MHKTDPDCLFCKIVAGTIPCQKVYEDEYCLAFHDIAPQAPTHLLVIPKQHIARLDEAQEADAALLGHLMLATGRIALQEKLEVCGFRTVINCGKGVGQAVFHLHLHILAGRTFHWPPG